MSERLIKLVERLHEKSLRGDITWEKAPTGFHVSFPRYTVGLSKTEWADRPITLLTIYGPSGEIIDTVDEEDLVVVDDEAGQLDYSVGERLSETYEAARRQALGRDKAIEEILEALEKTPG